jgi:hypothetical protein
MYHLPAAAKVLQLLANGIQNQMVVIDGELWAAECGVYICRRIRVSEMCDMCRHQHHQHVSNEEYWGQNADGA